MGKYADQSWPKVISVAGEVSETRIMPGAAGVGQDRGDGAAKCGPVAAIYIKLN